MSQASKTRQDDESAYVLHSYPYRETSLVVETFTRDFGRVALIARGARRPRSALRGLLLGFQPLRLGWYGKTELRTLMRAEWVGGLPQLGGEALMCGFYLNELLLKLLHRDDPHDLLFDAYDQALRALAAGTGNAAALRRFEKSMLQQLGYALTLDREAETGTPVDPAARYTYVPERGPLRLDAAGPLENRVELCGRTLLDLACDDYSAAVTMAEAKQLMRVLIGHYLGGQTLHTRQLLIDLQQL